MRDRTKQLVCLAWLLLSPSLGLSFDFRLKFSPGLWSINPQDVNSALGGWKESVVGRVPLNPTWILEGENVDSMRLGSSFEAEIMAFATPRLAFGFSAGYVYSDLSEEEVYIVIVQEGLPYIRAHPTKISAYPFMFSAYYSIPLASKLQVYLRAGTGYIRAKYVDRSALKTSEEGRFDYSDFQAARAGNSAFLGGLGLAYAFDQAVGFFVEAEVHAAKVSGFVGDMSLSEEAILYYLEEYDEELDYWQPKLLLETEMPSSGKIRSVREARVDFSGFSIKIGINLKF